MWSFYPGTFRHFIPEVTIMCIIEGGFILSKSLQDAKLIARAVRQFRRYLQLIFEE